MPHFFYLEIRKKEKEEYVSGIKSNFIFIIKKVELFLTTNVWEKCEGGRNVVRKNCFFYLFILNLAKI